MAAVPTTAAQMDATIAVLIFRLLQENVKHRTPAYFLLCAAVLLAGAPPAFAQDLAGRRVRVVVPFTPGGSMDNLARVVASGLEKDAGAVVIVENKPGAGGNIAAAYVARNSGAPFTNLLVTSINHYVNPAMMRDPGYDAYKDFTPVAYLSSMPYVMVVPDASPFSSVGDLVKQAKAKPGALSWGFGGNGTLGHFLGLALEDAAGFKGNPISYRGGGDLMAALAGKHVDSVIMTVQSAAPLVKQGRLKALAVTGEQRNNVLPMVPTFGEEVPGYPPLAGYAFLLASSATPEPLLVQVHAALNRIVKSEAFQQRLVGDGATTQIFATLGEAKKWFEADGPRWEAATRKSGIKVE
jgi:tripartite-type tricarboxylate transporter receptor subunit TctC